MFSILLSIGYYAVIAAAIVLFIGIIFGRHIVGGFFGLYRIVPINEAHLRVLRNKTAIFSARTHTSAYWYIPFITKLHKLPLCNLAIPVNDIKLNDKNMAKFVCDVMCFININDLILAFERLTLTDTKDDLGFNFAKLSEELRAIMESVCRTVTTKQTILDIYMHRQMLDEAITAEVKSVFPKWGIELVDLELKDIKDAPGIGKGDPTSTIIADIERKNAAEIRRDAEVMIAGTTREAEIAKAVAEEAYKKRQIEKDRAIGIAEQEKAQEISVAQSKANQTAVDASRVQQVGNAQVAKEKIEQEAMAQKIKLSTEAEGQASKVLTEGKAAADVIRLTKEADATGTSAQAKALKEFDDVAINVKILDVQKDIMISKFKALAEAMKNADIKWIISGAQAQKFFGINLDAEGGANMEQFLHESGLSKETINQILSKAKEEIKTKGGTKA